MRKFYISIFVKISNQMVFKQMLETNWLLLKKIKENGNFWLMWVIIEPFITYSHINNINNSELFIPHE